MRRFAPHPLLTSTFFLILLCRLDFGSGEDDLSRACSAVFHKITTNGEPLRFRFAYSKAYRLRQLLTGDFFGSMVEQIPLPAPEGHPSSDIPAFTCILVFTAPPSISHPQDTRILVRITDLNLGSGPFGCGNAGDAVRVYSILRGRLFLVREFCGNDMYSPAVITESHMAVVTITFSKSYIGLETRRFLLNVEAHKNIFQTIQHSTSIVPHIPEIANLNMYGMMQEQNQQNNKWNKYPGYFSEWKVPLDNGNNWEIKGTNQQLSERDNKWNTLSNYFSEWKVPMENENNWQNSIMNSAVNWNIYIPSERWKRSEELTNYTTKLL